MKSDKDFLIKGALINGVGLISRVISPLLVILLARIFPPAVFGLFIAFQALVLTLSKFSTLALDKGLLWYVSRMSGEDDRTNHGLSGSILIGSLISGVLFLGIAIAGWTGLLSHFESLEGASLPFILMMAASLWPYTLIQLFASALEGLRMPQFRVVIALFMTTSLIPSIAFLLKGPLPDDMSLGAGMLLGNLVGMAAFIPFIRKYFPREKWFLGVNVPPPLLRYSLPLAFSEVVTPLLGRVDLWMILFLLGPEKVAVYAVMVTIANGLRTVRQTFDPLLIPIISRLKPEELRTNLRSSFSYATYMVSTIQLFIAFFVMIFPKEILSLAGKSYAIEIFAFALLLLGNLANGFLGLNGLVVLGVGNSRLASAIVLSALGLSIIGNWVLIPPLGIAGAALVSCLVLLYQNLVQFVYVRFVLKLRLYEPFLYINAVMEIGLIVFFFLAYHRIESQPLGARIGLFLGLSLFLGVWVLVKRKWIGVR